MYGRETPDGWLRDALWLAVGRAVIWEAGATHYVDEPPVTVEPR